MSCYKCGSKYHKKAKCPQIAEKKRQQTTCFECGSVGHYRNECTVLKNKMEMEKQAIQEKEDIEWFNEHLPYQNKILVNAEETRNFLTADSYTEFWLKSDKDFCKVEYGSDMIAKIYPDSKSLRFYVINGNINTYKNIPSERAICGMNVDQFITFLGKSGHFTNILSTITLKNEAPKVSHIELAYK